MNAALFGSLLPPPAHRIRPNRDIPHSVPPFPAASLSLCSSSRPLSVRCKTAAIAGASGAEDMWPFSIDTVAADDAPTSIELKPIAGEEQFDRVIAEAQQLEVEVIILWMASWCRKCIYLKPKLEKLAAEYHPRIQFYSIDVNSVPQRLVNRAGITKMPTIQLWKDCNKQSEVLGGHQAWMVVNDVRQMIDSPY